MATVRDRKSVAEWSPNADFVTAGPLAHQRRHLADFDKSKFHAGQITIRITINIEQSKRSSQQRIAAFRRTNHEELTGNNCRRQLGRVNFHGPRILSHQPNSFDGCNVLPRAHHHSRKRSGRFVSHEATSTLEFSVDRLSQSVQAIRSRNRLSLLESALVSAVIFNKKCPLCYRASLQWSRIGKTPARKIARQLST